MNRFNTLTQQGILVMYIPTIFMGKDANEETPEKNSMDWLGAHNRPGWLSIFGCLALWILWVFDTVLRDEPSRSPKGMVFFLVGEPLGDGSTVMIKPSGCHNCWRSINAQLFWCEQQRFFYSKGLNPYPNDESISLGFFEMG